MARLLGERRVDEGVDDRERLLGGVHTAADTDELCVVVLAGKLGDLDIPGECAPRTLDLVRRDLLTVAATAEHDAEAARIVDGLLCGGDAECGVVVLRVVLVSAGIDHFVPVRLEVFGDLGFEFESGMVATDVYAHSDHYRLKAVDDSSPIPNVPGLADPAPTTAHYDPNRRWLTPAKYAAQPRLHPWEIPTLVVLILLSVVGYAITVVLVMFGVFNQLALLALALPLLLFLIRGITYATPRANGVQMTPTQFVEGYRMVVEAAARYGLEYVPDAYVVLGNGQINAFASGHGFRRYVVVYSDLFEIGGRARDPEALRFIIGHEVGHIAAGHTSYWRQLATSIGMQIPILGSLLSRAQEYSADNFGYYTQPDGAPRAMGVLSAGKYMLRAVDFDQLADRATHEKGFFIFLVNLLASHPVLTWRAAALRDRTRPGAILFRPRTIVRGVGSGNAVPVTPPPHPAAVAEGSLPNGLEAPPKF